MSIYNNRKYIIENSNPLTNHWLTKLLCQQNNGFQLIYLESYAYLSGLTLQQTNQALKQAFCYQLIQSKLKEDTLQSLHTGLIETASSITAKNKYLENTRSQYYKAYPHGNKDQHAIKLQHSLQIALHTKDNTKINDLTVKLNKQTKRDPRNFWIAFDIAWIYFHIEQNIQKAEQQLIQAADYALQEKSPLATLILRYLAYAKCILGKNEEALECIQSVSQLAPTEQEQPQSIYESIQFNCIITFSYKQQIRLQKLIRQQPLYYIYTQTDQHLYAIKNIQNLLLRFHIEKLEQIKQCTLKKWQASHLYQSELPKEFDKNALFDDNFQSYQTLLSHQTYPTLCKIENISKKITTQITANVNKQLTMAQTRYVKQIIEAQKKWKKVNQLGGILLYATVIISFATLLLWTSTLIMETPILSENNWKNILPKFIITLSLSTVISLLLMRSTPPTNRKRFKQTQLLQHAVTHPQQKIKKGQACKSLLKSKTQRPIDFKTHLSNP